MPMTIVAVESDPSLSHDLAEAQADADANGFSVIPGFNGPGDLVNSITAMLDANNFDCLEALEIVCHGNTTSADGIFNANAAAFGAQLKALRLCDIVDVYLSGCNTAINLQGRNSVAQEVSASGPTIADDNIMLTVYGSVGYLSGMHMNGSERAEENVIINGVPYAGFPNAYDSRGGPGVNIGSYNAVGDASWRGYREGRRVK